MTKISTNQQKNQHNLWTNKSQHRKYQSVLNINRCLISLILREMQIKKKIKYYISPLNLAEIKSGPIGKTVGEKALIYFWWELPSNFYGRQFDNISITNACTFWYRSYLQEFILQINCHTQAKLHLYKIIHCNIIWNNNG